MQKLINLFKIMDIGSRPSSNSFVVQPPAPARAVIKKAEENSDVPIGIFYSNLVLSFYSPE